MTTDIKTVIVSWIRTIRFFDRIYANNNDMNTRENSNRGQLKRVLLMEWTFIPHFADAAVLGMPFGLIFIEDSAFSFSVSLNERRSILRLLFYQRDHCSIRKMLFCHYNKQHFSIFFYRAAQLDRLFPKGNIYFKLNFGKSKRNILFIWRNILLYKNFVHLLHSLENCKTVISLGSLYMWLSNVIFLIYVVFILYVCKTCVYFNLIVVF